MPCPSVRISCLLALLVSMTQATPAPAIAPSSEPDFRGHVGSLVADGSLGYEQGLLLRFQRTFSPRDLPSELDSPAAWPTKSATSLLLEYRDMRDAISRPVASLLDGYLRIEPSPAAEVYETDHFRLVYEREGPDAPPAADLDPANGVPDFVEDIGAYAEISWNKLIAETGFTSPRPAGEKTPILFREMASYGYTQPVDGSTQIILHRDFLGFPANHDPEGSAKGAAKVTVAHELKHASQFAASGWTEGGWLEADATWAEDYVFDETDDYLRYLPYGSPISHPDRWLENGQPSYEDCLWQHLIVESLGVTTLVDFFARRALHPIEPVMASFDHVLSASPATREQATGALAVWSYLCGANAYARPTGFEEADSYPTPRHSGQIFHASETFSRALPGMGTHFVLVGGAERSGHPRISLSSGSEAAFAVHAITLSREGVREVIPVPLENSRVSEFPIDITWVDLALMAVTVTNVGRPGSAKEYFLSVDDDHATGIPGLASENGFSLEPNRPNPFRRMTSIPFSLAREQSVRLAIYDVGGRLVRRLLEEERLGVGEHERVWDGTDEGGRLAAPGVYYYRLEIPATAETRKMLLLR